MLEEHHKRIVPPKYKIERLPQDDDELWYFIQAIFGLKVPRTRVCPDHATPFEALADAYFARSPVTVWKASRGYGGKSYTLALLAALEALNLGAETNVLGGSGAQSLNVHNHTKEMWEHGNSPKSMLARESTKFDTWLVNGGHIRTLMASQNSVRGPHPQRLRLDEIDEMDMDVLEAAQGQPMRKKKDGEIIETQTVMSSTHQYPDSTMSAILERARVQGWPIYQWCIGQYNRVHTSRGLVPIKDVTTDDKILTRDGWRQVQHVTLMGYKPVLKIDLPNGRSLTCTSDHRIAVPGGFVEASDLYASTTVSSSTRAGVEIRAAKGMSTKTVSLGTPSIVPTVFAGLDSYKVIGIDARSSSTGVVNFNTSANITFVDSIRKAMSKLFSPFVRTSTNLPVSRRVSGKLPDPAGVITLDDSLFDVVGIHGDSGGLPVQSVGAAFASLGSPVFDFASAFTVSHVASVSDGQYDYVYDIGVEGTHEFVAEGVVVHNCYKETSNPVDGWLTQSEVDRKRLEIPAHMWETEYDLQEPNFEGRAIDSAMVMLSFPEGMGIYSGEEPVRAQMPGEGKYITGVDWAKSKDYTIAATYKVTSFNPVKYECVAWQKMSRMTWPVMVGKVIEQWREYGGALVHDATGLGAVVDDLIKERVTPREAKMVKPVVMKGGEWRAALFSEYVAAIERQDIVSPRIDFAYREHLYVSNDDLYKSGGHPPDTIVAGAIAWKARPKMRVQVALPQGIGKESVFGWHV